MAKVRGNLILQGVSGMIGKQLIIRKQKDGTYVLTAAPVVRAGREPTPAQKQQQERFRQAVLYATVAKGTPED